MHARDMILLYAAEVLYVEALACCRIDVILEPGLPQAPASALYFDILFSVDYSEAILTKDIVHRIHYLLLQVINRSKGSLGLFFEEIVRSVAKESRHVLALVEVIELLVPETHPSDEGQLLFKLLLCNLLLITGTRLARRRLMVTLLAVCEGWHTFGL